MASHLTAAAKQQLPIRCLGPPWGPADILKALQPGTLPSELDSMMLGGWVRGQVWNRACEAGEEVARSVAAQVLHMDIEALLQAIMPWYEPLMRSRRLQSWRSSGDRLDILCFDGNAKLHRRSCGAPCAESRFVPSLDLHLERGCPESPQQQGVLCSHHAALRSRTDLAAQISKHRMVQPLSSSPFLELEVQLAGFQQRWQPACTVPADTLQAYFAVHGGDVVEARKEKRAAQRESQRRPVRYPLLGDWSSESTKTKCACKTHKESMAAVKTASRSAGFLLAVSQSGIIAGLQEIITAETLSQRYAFLAEMAEATPELKGSVHDDNCHVRLFSKTHRREDNAMSKRLSSPDFFYIIDRPHSRGHVDAVCRSECFPDVPRNSDFLRDFPTPVCETVNSEMSPLAHTIHHMQRWLCMFCVNECADVHNELRAQRREEARMRQEKKRAREERAASRARAPRAIIKAGACRLAAPAEGGAG